MSIAEALAAFAVTTRSDDPTMARFVRFSLYDWIGVGLAGMNEPVALAARRLALSEGGTGQATLLGGGRGSARAVALANGATSHALDYDDTHFLHIGHPSVAVIPAALALAEARDAGAGVFLDALAVGLETCCRIGDWLGRSHYEAGFHQTGTAGAFGATAAAGRILGLDAGRMAHALALTATRAAGLKSQFGTMGKPLNAGFAAETGVSCALLAEAGAMSADDAIEGTQGFGSTHAATPRPEALDGLGKNWVFPAISYKFHACCHGLHAMLEAIRTLAPRLPEPSRIGSVEIETHPRWLAVCDQPRPTTGLGAKFSYRLTAAMALSGMDTARLDAYDAETCARPNLVALRDRVTVRGEDTLTDTEARVTIRIGQERRDAVADILATSDPDQIEHRLRQKVAALHGAQMANEILHAVTDLQAGSCLGPLLKFVAGRPTQR